MTKTPSIILKLLVKLFTHLPFGVIYLLSDGMAFLFINVFQYRKKVVLQNLKNSFPDKSEQEVNQIAKLFYKHFCDILVESIKGLSMSKKDLQERFVFKNPEIFQKSVPQNQSAILLGSHYGNWEWGVLSFPLAVQHKVIGVFKPLSNKPINAFLNKKRKQWGLHLTGMKGTGRAIVENRNQPAIFVFIADQTPSDVKNAHWFNFLNQDTPFLHGAEKIARKTGYPVFHFNIKRVKRGFYEVTFEPLCLEPTCTPPGSITKLYAQKLEKAILSAPADWLWSHRRWKRKRPMN